MKTLTRTGFAAYLSSRGRKSAGEPGRAERCPIAQYLTATTKAKGRAAAVSVGTDTIAVGSRSYATPAWVTRFIGKIDALKRDKWVSGNAALRILTPINLSTRGRR